MIVDEGDLVDDLVVLARRARDHGIQGGHVGAAVLEHLAHGLRKLEVEQAHTAVVGVVLVRGVDFAGAQEGCRCSEIRVLPLISTSEQPVT